MDYIKEKQEMAAVFRWSERLKMNQGIANHFSLAVSEDGQKFLMNPVGIYWSKMKASDIILLDTESQPENLGPVVDKTAWGIHGAIHRKIPQARCVMHLHPKYATVLSSLKDPTLPPIDQNSMMFYNRISYDNGYDGFGVGPEGDRLAGLIGNHSVLMMGQHGILVVAENIAEAFDKIYYFEQAAMTYITALQTGKELNIASKEVAEKTARQAETFIKDSVYHLKAICNVLNEEEPEYLQ